MTAVSRIKSLRTLLAADAGKYLLSSLAALGGLAVINVLAANALGPAGKGELSLLLTVAVLTSTASTLGLELSLCRAGSRGTGSLPPLMPPIAGVGALGFFVGTAATLALGSLAGDVAVLPAALVTGVASASLASALVSTGLLAAQPAATTVLASRTIGAAVMITGATGAVALGADVLSLMAAVAVGGVATVAAQIAALRNRDGAARVSSPNSVLPRPLLASGLRSHAGTVIQSLAYRLDFFIVAALLGSAELGVYSVSVMLIQVLWFAPDALGMSLLQRTASRGPGRSSLTELRAAVANGCIAGLLGASILAGTAWLFLVPAFGEGFGDAYEPLVILLPGALALSYWKLAVNYLFARGHDLSKTLGAGVAAVASVGLDFLLIPKYGLNGAAAAASIGYFGATLSASVELYFREGLTFRLLLAGRFEAG